jgi:hypothetical protein
MSAPASLRTGKNRRRALRALLAGPLLALGIAAGPGTAHASDPVFTPAEVHLADGHCSVSGWPHGEIFCGTSVGANFPDGTQEIFGIGLNDAMWTDWGTEASPSGWKSMGAPPTSRCDPGSTDGLSNDGDYALVLDCHDFSGTLWFNDRGAGASAGWSGWHLL